MMRAPMIALTALVVAGAAFAHTGVKNAAVKARMDAMSAIGAEMKTLGQMAKGAAAFDRDKARSAVAAIARHAAETPALFEAREDDPKSEALPTIWSDAPGFAKATEEMDSMLAGADVSSAQAISLTLRDMAQACSVCHESYREKN